MVGPINATNQAFLIAAGNGGGIYHDNGTLNLADSTVSGSTAYLGGGIYIAHNSGTDATANVTGCTLSGCNAVLDGSFQYGLGGGIYVDGLDSNRYGNLNLINSTISGCQADAQGGGIASAGHVTVKNSTIANNHALQDENFYNSYRGGGGIYQDTQEDASVLTLLNTIIANNQSKDDSGDDQRDDFQYSSNPGEFTDNGYNAIGITTDGNQLPPIYLTAAGDWNLNGTSGDTYNKVGGGSGDLKLAGALADNGGPTLTLALLSGSIAVGAIPTNSSWNGSPATDQRGHTRPSGEATSIGAVAYNGATLVVLYDFFLREENGQIQVCWQTASETETLGFDVYREENGAWVKVNSAMIPAAGWPNGGVGANYCVADAGASADGTHRYKLVEFETTGGMREYGPFERTLWTPRMSSVTITPVGVVVQWQSRAGERYDVLKAASPRAAYLPVAQGLPATPPVNAWTDQTPTASGFYRIEAR